MKMSRTLLMLLTLALAATTLTGCGSIETGNVGVRTFYGTVDMAEETPGFYTSFLSSVDEYTVKEIVVPLKDLTPKAADNLSLDDLDVDVAYIPRRDKVAEFLTDRKGQTGNDETGLGYPGSLMVEAIASSVILSEVSKFNSLTMHTQREKLEDAVKVKLQLELDAAVPGFFKVSRVVVSSLDTDDSIEKSIQDVVKNQKLLESMAIQEQIAAKRAAIEVVKANGIAQANNIINGSLTREYLQHESNEAMKMFASNSGTRTVVIPANMPVAPLINVN